MFLVHIFVHLDLFTEVNYLERLSQVIFYIWSKSVHAMLSYLTHTHTHTHRDLSSWGYRELKCPHVEPWERIRRSSLSDARAPDSSGRNALIHLSAGRGTETDGEDRVDRGLGGRSVFLSVLSSVLKHICVFLLHEPWKRRTSNEDGQNGAAPVVISLPPVRQMRPLRPPRPLCLSKQ